MQKLQDATVDVERLGELFLITRARVRGAQRVVAPAKSPRGAPPSPLPPKRPHARALASTASHQIVEADKQRQANREALSALRRADRAASSSGASASDGSGGRGSGSGSPQRKVWLLSPAAAAGGCSGGGTATFTRHTAAGGVTALEAGVARR